jgi:two-component system, OmpR family, response regulator VicR
MLDTGYELDLVPGRARIAVIDDDPVFVDLMHDLLANGEGYEVVSSSHWIQSYEFIKDAQPDLVILDLMMGREQTGWAVLQLLQEDPSTARIPVILCSAAEPALRRYACRMNGAATVEAIAKPFDVDHLLGLIARLLEQHSRRRVS